MVFIRRGEDDRHRQGDCGLRPETASHVDSTKAERAPEQHGEDRVFGQMRPLADQENEPGRSSPRKYRASANGGTAPGNRDVCSVESRSVDAVNMSVIQRSTGSQDLSTSEKRKPTV